MFWNLVMSVCHKADASGEESAPHTVDLQHVLKELKNLQVKFDTQIKQNQTQNKKQNNPKQRLKKAQTLQVQCGKLNVKTGTQGAQASYQGPAGQRSSWKPRTDDQPRVFRGKCYNCKSLGHTMVMCPEPLDMEQVRVNVEEVKTLIARRKTAEDVEPHHELNHDEGNRVAKMERVWDKVERRLVAEPFDPETSEMIFEMTANANENTREVVEGLFSKTLGVQVKVLNAEWTTRRDKPAAIKVELETVWDRVSVLYG